MRTGAGFGVILDRKDREFPMAEAFQAFVIEVNVRDFYLFRIQTFRINCEAVVMRSDLDATGGEILDGLISAAMTEFQFIGSTTESESQHLMTETDPENRRRRYQQFHLADDFRDRGRVSGPIR